MAPRNQGYMDVGRSVADGVGNPDTKGSGDAVSKGSPSFCANGVTQRQTSADGSTVEEDWVDSDMLMSVFDIVESSVAVEGRASIWGSIFNLANTMMGAGILGLPYAVESLGYCLGLISLFVIGIISAFTMYIMITTGKLNGAQTYEDLAFRSFGPTGKKFLQLTMVFSQMGVLSAYLVLLADFLSPLLGHLIPLRAADMVLGVRAFIIIAATTFFILPLSLIRDISSLRFTSALSIFLMAVFLACISYRMAVPFADSVSQSPDPVAGRGVHELQPIITQKAFSFDLKGFRCLPIVLYSFACHVCVFPIYNALERPTLTRMGYVIAGASCLCLTMYTLTAIVGLYLFAPSLHPNILNNFSPNDSMIGVVRALFAIIVMTSYPLCLHASRRSLDTLCFAKDNIHIPQHRFVHETLFFVTLTIVIAVVVPSVKVVFQFTGSIFSTILMFLVPTSCFLMWAPPYMKIERITAWIVLIVASIVGTITTYLNIMDVMAGTKN